MPFELTRVPLDTVFRRVALAAREEVVPGYLRIRLAGEELAGFGSPGADDHIRIFFPPHDAHGASVEEFRKAPSREYTPLAWGDGWLDLEFVIHGDGPASSWAESAPIGAAAGFGGPRATLLVEGEPDAWVLAGDETAVPQLKRYLARAGADAVGTVLIEVAAPGREVPVDAPAGIDVRYAFRTETALAAALGQLERPEGDVLLFAAAESGIVLGGRLVLDRWGIDPQRAVVKGYWRRGAPGEH